MSKTVELTYSEIINSPNSGNFFLKLAIVGEFSQKICLLNEYINMVVL